MNGTGYDSDSASQMDVSLTLPVFLCCWEKHAALINNRRRANDNKGKNLSLIKVRMWLKPHLTAVLAGGLQLKSERTLSVRNTGWMFFAK